MFEGKSTNPADLTGLLISMIIGWNADGPSPFVIA